MNDGSSVWDRVFVGSRTHRYSGREGCGCLWNLYLFSSSFEFWPRLSLRRQGCISFVLLFWADARPAWPLTFYSALQYVAVVKSAEEGFHLKFPLRWSW